MARNYHLQHFEKECYLCKHIDSIREPVVPGDRGKVKYYLCAVGPHRIQVEKQGICDLYKAKEAKCQKPEIETITYDDAIKMLPDGSEIHTFVNPHGMLIGADRSREEILNLLKSGAIKLSGWTATRMNHGLVVFDGEKNIFISTRKEPKCQR